MTHLFHDQLSSIKLNEISVELPTVLPDFTQTEKDQAIFAINVIQIRKLAASITEASGKKMEAGAIVNKFRKRLLRFYQALPDVLRFGQCGINRDKRPDISVWSRRNYFCILLDYCLCWISLYRPLLPSASIQRALTPKETEAILYTSQASVAIIQLFQNWFQSSIQSDEGFDCFFRPYLYHFMSAKHVFSVS